jgi:hypothetical protein
MFKLILLQKKKIKRLAIKDKTMPTPINFYRVDILVSSIANSYCFGIVRIFNILSLYFGERGGTKTCYPLLLCWAQASGPGLTSNRQMAMFAHCYCDPH